MKSDISWRKALKKLHINLFLITFASLMISCGGQIKVDYAASDYVGRNYAEVIYELKDKGFTVFENTEIEDLSSDDSLPDGSIEMITINGEADFRKNSRFDPEACVAIKYHTIKKLKIPFSDSDIVTTDIKSIADQLDHAGFTNISSEEIYDLDPDSTNDDYKNEVIVNGAPFSQDTEYPFDAIVKVIRHYPYEKYDVFLSIDFSRNLLFNKYGVAVLLDGDKIANLSYAEDWNSSLRIKKGTHEIAFIKEDDETTKGSTTFDINSKSEISYKIKTHSDYVKVETLSFKVLPGEDEVLNSYDKDTLLHKEYTYVEESLKTLGFTNIISKPAEHYNTNFSQDSVLDIVLEDSALQIDKIYKKDILITIYYNDIPSKQDDNSVTASSEKASTNNITQKNNYDDTADEPQSDQNDISSLEEKITEDNSSKELVYPFEFDEKYTRTQNFYLYLDTARKASIDTIKEQAENSGLQVSIKNIESEESGNIIIKELYISGLNERIYAEYAKDGGGYKYRRLHYYVSGNERDIQIYFDGKKNIYSFHNKNNWLDSNSYSSLRDAIDSFYMPDGMYFSTQDKYLQVKNGEKSIVD